MQKVNTSITLKYIYYKTVEFFKRSYAKIKSTSTFKANQFEGIVLKICYWQRSYEPQMPRTAFPRQKDSDVYL